MADIPITEYKQVLGGLPWTTKVRTRLRDAVISGLSLSRRIDRTSGWIRFPYYHHIYNDERRGFSAQLDYLRNFGEFVSLDDAVSLLEQRSPLDGRYFSVSLDDSNHDCMTNAFPALVEKGIRATFFLTVERIGAAPATVSAPHGDRWTNPYMTWDDCRKLAQAGMTLGSHGYSHVRLGALSEAEAMRELRDSRQTIEKTVGCPCVHFSCPWGKPESDLDTGRDVMLARAAGYRSFSTSQRGAMRRGDSPFLIRRDQLLASWSKQQVRYFLSN